PTGMHVEYGTFLLPKSTLMMNPHFRDIRKLCSYMHPALSGPDGIVPKFNNLKELRRHVQHDLGLTFCDICLGGRKVFIAEQVLYTKGDLHKHVRTGDLEGPLAESGFKGHPDCRFCRKRMSTTRDYNELLEHFRHEHYMCEHPVCMERKFVVFLTEAEMKQHAAREHGGNMSRQERRQALTIPVNLQFRRDGGQEEGGGQPGHHHHRHAAPEGIQIGGPSGMPNRHSHRRHHRTRQPEGYDDPSLAPGLPTNREHRHREQQERRSPDPRHTGRPEEFPLPNGDQAGPSSSAAGGGQWAAMYGGSGRAPRPEDFPALPGTSKSAKKRAKQKDRSMAESLGLRSRGSVQVLNRGGAASSSNNHPSGALSDDEERRRRPSDDFPSLRASTPQPFSISQSRATAPEPRPAARGRREADFPALASQSQPITASTPAPAPAPAATQAVPAAPQISSASFHASLSSRPRTSSSQRPAASASASAGSRPQEDFPTLGGPRAAAAAASADGSSGISEGLKAANKALIERVRQKLDAEAFAQFKQHTAQFARGSLSPPDFHTQLVSLGLAGLIPDMAALLPDASKRASLLAVHSASFGSAPVEAMQASWVPPEAAAAAAAAADQSSSWSCPTCTLINAPHTTRCEACHKNRPPKPSQPTPQGNEPAVQLTAPRAGLLSSGVGDALADGRAGSAMPDGQQAASAGGQEDEKGKGKARRIPKFERLRVTGGDPDATESFLDSMREKSSHPQNPWAQNRTGAGPAPQTGGGTGNAWAKGGGKLASETKAINAAWGKR
ncbi:hypothetical protein WJX84_008852, partial [Apatococcus fuscideae]